MPKPRPKSKIKNRKSKIVWERLLLIHQRIKSGSCPSASALAAELETSPPPFASSAFIRAHPRSSVVEILCLLSSLRFIFFVFFVFFVFEFFASFASFRG
jgi:hypothetical protein